MFRLVALINDDLDAPSPALLAVSARSNQQLSAHHHSLEIRAGRREQARIAPAALAVTTEHLAWPRTLMG